LATGLDPRAVMLSSPLRWIHELNCWLEDVMRSIALALFLTAAGAGPAHPELAKPRPKPMTPVLFAHAYSLTDLGKELLDGVEKPTLQQGADNPYRWLVVSVWSALLPAGEAVLETVTLTVVQGKAKTVLRLKQRGLDGDTEIIPFVVPIAPTCEPIDLTAAIGKRSTNARLRLVCEQ
jgi:hypothetical protein